MILLPVVFFLALVMIASRRIKGPLWALSLAWLISIVPLTTGFITFNTLSDRDFGYSLTLIAFLAPFVAGAGLFYLLPRTAAALPAPAQQVAASDAALGLVWLCWGIGIAGAACIIADFYLLGGVGLSDLAALRDAFVEKKSASFLAQIGSIMTWACLYSFIYVLLYRHRLGSWRSSVLMLPIFGYFMLSLLSAGRQAAFQVMLVTGMTFAVAAARRRRLPFEPTSQRGSKLLIVGISAAMITYMGVIVIFRNDQTISDDKTDVLLALFDFRMSPLLVGIGNAVGQSVRSIIVEGLVYFSSSIAIFQQSLLVHLPPAYGAMSLPVVLRQLEPLTGISQAGAMAARIDALNALGVVGNAWTTAFSSYLIDFGPWGAVIVTFLSGYYSSYAWHRALSSTRFDDIVIAVIVLVAAVYTPLYPATADNNLLLLWLFCLIAPSVRATLATRRRDRSPEAFPTISASSLT